MSTIEWDISQTFTPVLLLAWQPINDHRAVNPVPNKADRLFRRNVEECPDRSCFNDNDSDKVR